MAHTGFLDDESVLRAELRTQGQTALWGDVVHGWQTDPGMTEVFMGVLAEAPFDAFFFETPAVSRDTLDRAFEFVLIDCPSLAGVAPEPWIFEEHFGSDQDTDGVATFPNIGADALLVTPYPARPPRNYAHLAAFTRQAPREQQLALWHAVGEAARQWFRGRDPVWISTSGLEVFWLHVRLDSHPKYYNHAPYRLWGPG
jgi:hypothetical protein